MKNRTFLLIGILLVCLCAAVILVQGQTYTVTVDTRGISENASDFRVVLDGDTSCVALTDQWMENGFLHLKFSSVYKGKVFVDVYGPEDAVYMCSLHSHGNGVLTHNGWIGDCSGARVIPLAISLYLALALWLLRKRYNYFEETEFYRYRNIVYLGLGIFCVFLLFDQLNRLFHFTGLVQTLRSVLSSAANFSSTTLPIAFVLSLFVTGTNIQLMRREGRNWRNMLGALLGLLLCFSTVFPMFLGEWLQRTTLVDVHYEQGWAMYVEMALDSAIYIMVAYLECMLAATIIYAVKAAHRMPAFDKDYMIILGSRMRADGTLTPLLQGRVDKALEFARLQKEKTGKELVFVPSGGQGRDEPLAEAAAMKNYLLGVGVPEAQILAEDASANTFENFGNSMALIRQREGEGADPQIAFSTTNYHVLRAGLYAAKQGIRADGVGSPTKRYFWVNAFVREFIAMMAAEKKRHALAVLLLILASFVMVLLVRLSNF